MIRDDRLMIRMIRDLTILIRSFGHSHSLILVGGRYDVAIYERTIYDLRFLPTMAMRTKNFWRKICDLHEIFFGDLLGF